jgi:hypothetical protein
MYKSRIGFHWLRKLDFIWFKRGCTLIKEVRGLGRYILHGIHIIRVKSVVG